MPDYPSTIARIQVKDESGNWKTIGYQVGDLFLPSLIYGSQNLILKQKATSGELQPDLVSISGTALTGRDWSGDFAKLQNLPDMNLIKISGQALTARNWSLDFARLLKYQGVVSERVSVIADTTREEFNSSAVPSGEIWIVTMICAWNNSGNSTSVCSVGVVHDGAYYVSEIQPTLNRYVGLKYNGILILDAGDTMHGDFSGLTVGHQVVMDFLGYKMTAP